jgi:hypothetical protein
MILEQYPDLKTGRDKMSFEQFLIYHAYPNTFVGYRNFILRKMKKEYEDYTERFAK